MSFDNTMFGVVYLGTILLKPRELLLPDGRRVRTDGPPDMVMSGYFSCCSCWGADDERRRRTHHFVAGHLPLERRRAAGTNVLIL